MLTLFQDTEYTDVWNCTETVNIFGIWAFLLLCLTSGRSEELKGGEGETQVTELAEKIWIQTNERWMESQQLTTREPIFTTLHSVGTVIQECIWKPILTITDMYFRALSLAYCSKPSPAQLWLLGEDLAKKKKARKNHFVQIEYDDMIFM